MIDDVTYSTTSEQIAGSGSPSRLEDVFEKEVLKALGSEASPSRAADLYLSMAPFIVDCISEALDNLAKQGNAVRGEHGLFWKLAATKNHQPAEVGECVVAEQPEEARQPTEVGQPSETLDGLNQGTHDTIDKNDSLPSKLKLEAGEKEELSCSVPFGEDASQELEHLKKVCQATEISPEGSVSIEVSGTTYHIALQRLRIRNLSFSSLSEKAVFLQLLDYPPSEMVDELSCKYKDIDILVSNGLAEEPWMLSIVAARRYAQMNPSWVESQCSLVAWAASLFSEDRKLFTALFMGEDFGSASRSARISLRTAMKILKDSLRIFPQIDRIIEPDVKDRKPSTEPLTLISGDKSEKAIVESPAPTSGGKSEKVVLEPFMFDDVSDAVTFLHALGATPEQICGRLDFDANRYGDLLAQGVDRWMDCTREGKGSSRFNLCAWARELRRSDARLALLSLLGEDPRKASEETSYSLRELDTRLDKIFETAPNSHPHERHSPVEKTGVVALSPSRAGDVSPRTDEGKEDVDRWPAGVKEAGERGLLLALLGASVVERTRILCTNPARLNELIRKAADNDSEIAGAFTRRTDGKCFLDRSKMDESVFETSGNLMVWASRLTPQEKAILVGWLAGEDEARIAQLRAHASVLSVRETLGRLLPFLASATYTPQKSETTDSQQRRSAQPISDARTDSILSLAQWLATLDEMTRGVLLAFFSGDRLSDYAVKNGVSTANARRAYQAALKSRPPLVEDRYLYLYETYNVSPEDFTALTGLGSESYGYLKGISVRGGGYRHLRPSGVGDDKLPKEIRERLKDGGAGVSSSGMLRIDGKLVRSTFESLVRHFGSVHAQTRPMTIEVFGTTYTQFLDEHELGGREDLRLPGNPQTAVQRLSKTGRFLVPSQKHVRYYDYDTYDFSPLVEVLRTSASRNVECSARIIFRAHRTLMEALDLVDEYDLFAVVKRLLREVSVPGVGTGKCPILRFGECDRHAQVLEIIKEVSPATADEVAAAYEERYGVSSASFKSSYLREFAAYRKNNRYEYRERELDGGMKKFLAGELKGDYLVLSLVQARFEARFSQASKLDVNDIALAPFGYHTSHGLIVRNGIDEKSVFGALIDNHDQFALGDIGFDEAIVKYPVFRNELRARLASLSYVEWMRGHYLSVDRLSSAFGVGEHELRSYMDYVSSLAEPGVPFSVPGLLISGNWHELDSLRDDAGVEDSLYEGLIEFMPANEGIKRTSFDGTTVYCRSRGSFSTGDFLSYLAKRERHIELEDLVDLLEDEYGIRTSVGYVRNCVERAASDGLVFHNQALDTLLPSKEANSEFVRSCIDRG